MPRVTFLKYFQCTVVLFFCIVTLAFAQEYTLFRAEVMQIIPTEKDAYGRETIEAKILEGSEAGKLITIESVGPSIHVGETFYAERGTRQEDGTPVYYFVDFNRVPINYFLIGLFIICAVLVGGKQGIRGLLALTGSLLLIFFVLLPGIRAGHSPALLSVIVAVPIVMFGSYLTHGFNKTTTAAVIGMLVTITLTGALTYIIFPLAHLSGLWSEGAELLIDSGKAGDGGYDFTGILFCGMIIGFLGILIDIAVAQAIAVEELFRVNPLLSKKIARERALRMGREHIGTLINMLAILYVAAALPVLLYFLPADHGQPPVLNSEVFSMEIMRTMLGSIGLMLAVPITTVLAVFMLYKNQPKSSAKNDNIAT